jgi:hypothetical protein
MLGAIRANHISTSTLYLFTTTSKWFNANRAFKCFGFGNRTHLQDRLLKNVKIAKPAKVLIIEFEKYESIFL